jgi:hypothetical protein
MSVAGNIMFLIYDYLSEEPQTISDIAYEMGTGIHYRPYYLNDIWWGVNNLVALSLVGRSLGQGYYLKHPEIDSGGWF